MRAVDFAPLWRSTVGFDRLFDLMENAQGVTNEDNYPSTISNALAITAFKSRWPSPGLPPTILPSRLIRMC